jgi:hypothetical protein
MLKNFYFKNEDGKTILRKTIQYEKITDYALEFFKNNNDSKIAVLYNLPKVIENVKNNNIIYFVNSLDMVKALELDGKFATCFVTNTYDKKYLENSLKYLKNATIYILSDGEDGEEAIKNNIAEDNSKKLFDNIVKTNSNILKILVNIAKEIRLVDYNKQYKNFDFLKYNETIIDLFENYHKEFYISPIYGNYYIPIKNHDLIEKSWKKLIDTGIIIRKSNYNKIIKEYKYKIMLFDVLNELTN